MKKNFSLILTPAFVLVLISLIWTLILNPFLESTIKRILIQQVNKTQLIEAELDEALVQLFPPRLILSQLQLTPQAEASEILSPINIRQVDVEINAFKLLIGRIEINRVGVDRLDLKLQLDPLLARQSQPQELPVQIIFEILEKFPVRKIEAENIFVEILSHKNNLQGNFQNSKIVLSNLRNNLIFEVQAPQIVYSQTNYSQNFNFSLIGQMTPKDLLIDDLSFQNEDLASVSLTGLFKDWKNLMTNPEFDFQSQGFLDLTWLDRQLNNLLKTKPLLLEGKVEAQQRILFKNKEISASGKIAYQDFMILNNDIGSGSGLASYSQGKIELKNFAIQHPAGTAMLKRFDLDLKSDLSFVGTSQIQSLDLQELFQSIGLNQIPVWLNIAGDLKCHGQFKTPYNIDCQVDASAENLKVSASTKANSTVIAEIPDFKAQGGVQITNKAVSYNADIQVVENSGKSRGVIDYKSGFQISFETPALSFANLKSLVGLDFEGTVAIKGVTSGDSHSATFKMTTTAENFILEKYKLGQVEAELEYKKGLLNFNNLLGAYNRSQYLGDLQLDVNKNRISGRISAPVVEAEDLFKILDHLFVVPFPITGLGKAEMDFSGPFDFWNLDFNLKSNFNEVRFYRDRFDSVVLEAQAKDGVIKLGNTVAQKNQSRVIATGSIGPEQKLNLNIKTDNLRLEDSLLVSSLNSNFFGTLVADTEIRGNLKAPEVSLKAQVKNSVFSEQELPDSNLVLNLNSKKMNLTFDFLGSRLTGDLQYPFIKSEGPLQISAKAEDWQLSTFLSFLTGADSSQDFSAIVSGSVQLTSKTGSLFNADGSLQVTQADIRKSGQQIKNPRPMVVDFNNGNAKLSNFRLVGDGNEITLKGEDFNSENLNIQIESQLDLKFLHIFLPFLEEINGPSHLRASIRGPLLSPDIFGTAELNNTFVKLKGFPHAIEKIKSDISFSQNRVILNSVKAQMAGGTLQGDGTIQFVGLRNLPANLRLRIDNVSLNVPDQVKTQGYGELVLSGSWFPYTLGGSYRIINANIEKEFTEGMSGGQIKQSIYLPKVLREEVFEPLQLDLQIVSEKPLYIKNTLIEGYGRGNLQVKGTPTNPILLGRAGIEKDTKLNIKDKIFEIQTGTVTFNDPNEVNPDLFITAQARISDYEVNVLVQGNSKNPNIRLTSIPPLSDQDIISLLALGVTSSQLDQNIQSKDQQAQTGYEIGAAILSNNPLSKNLQDRLGVNLQFTSAYDSTRNIAVPKVTVSRRITDRLNASASRTLGDQTTVDVKMQLILNKNLSAIGTWEDREVNQNSDTLTDAAQRQNQSVFGLDLEYKVEFK